MTDRIISLDAIDFNNPDGEFTFRGETYLLKPYLGSYFIRNKRHVGLKFICFLDYGSLAESICQQEISPQDIEKLLENNHNYTYRCVQYKEALFGFGDIRDIYYSPKYDEWIYLKHISYKPHIDISLDGVFEKPYESFIEQAAIIYTQELTFVEDEDLFYSIREQEDQKIEFISGSQLELERLTKLAAWTLPELQHLFEHSSSLIVIYESDNKYRSGGVIQEIRTGGWNEITLSKAAKQLFNLIFEYNFFTGLNWEYNDGDSGYPGYDPHPCTIEVKVQAPSQHERIEAALELQNWLEGKLPEDEIQSYFNQ